MFHLSKHFLVLSSFMSYHRICNYINTTGATSRAVTAYPSRAPEFTPSFMCMFCRCCFVLLYFFVCPCVVCSSSIYGFWLPLWYLQTLLPLLTPNYILSILIKMYFKIMFKKKIMITTSNFPSIQKNNILRHNEWLQG